MNKLQEMDKAHCYTFLLASIYTSSSTQVYSDNYIVKEYLLFTLIFIGICTKTKSFISNISYTIQRCTIFSYRRSLLLLHYKDIALSRHSLWLGLDHLLLHQHLTISKFRDWGLFDFVDHHTRLSIRLFVEKGHSGVHQERLLDKFINLLLVGIPTSVLNTQVGTIPQFMVHGITRDKDSPQVTHSPFVEECGLDFGNIYTEGSVLCSTVGANEYSEGDADPYWGMSGAISTLFVG